MLKANIGVQAHFKLVAKTSEGRERILTNWFPNLVLNSGLDRMSQGAWFTDIAVGTGNSEPLSTQTGLDAFLASTRTVIEARSSRQINTLPYYHSFVTVFRFAQGAAAGNLSEIAMTWGGNNCWNRALIKDIDGKPTTITVLPNEFLDVYTELRIYPKITDTVTTVDLLNAKGSVESKHIVTVRPDMFRDIYHSISSKVGEDSVKFGSSLNNTSYIYVHGDNATLGGVTENISGSTTGVYTISLSNNSYPTSRSCKFSMQLSITQIIGSHKVLSVPSLLGYWKLEYNPPISKSNTQTLEHNFAISWGRYEPT